MKIDFYSPKNYYGFHIASLSGYMSLWVFIWLQEGDGNVFAFIGMPIFFFLILFPIPFYTLEWLFQSKVKNQFFLKNKVYDFFFDLGCLLYFLPTLGFVLMYCIEILPAILILIAIFVTIRTLKFLQDLREKKNRPKRIKNKSMKIDFYSPKNYYGSHIVAWSGYLCLWVFIWISPFDDGVCGNGGVAAWLAVIVISSFFFLLPMPFYILEWFFQSKVKNQFFLKNKVYDFFFDLGCVFYLLPIVWQLEACKFRILPFALLIAIFLTIRTLKFAQDLREKKEKANDAQAEAVTPPPLNE